MVDVLKCVIKVMFACEHGVTSISVTFIVLVSKPTSRRLWVIVCCIYVCVVSMWVIVCCICVSVCLYLDMRPLTLNCLPLKIFQLLALKDFCAGNGRSFEMAHKGPRGGQVIKFFSYAIKKF